MLNDIEYLACELPETLKAFHYAGYFEREIAEIDKMLQNPRFSSVPAMKKRLELERVIAGGLIYDYTISYDDAFERFSERYSDFTRADLDSLITDGALDWHFVNGELKIHNSAITSVLYNSPKLYPRIKDAELYAAYNSVSHSPSAVMESMKRDGKITLRHHIRHTVWPDADSRRDGERILVHIPYPLQTREQTDITLNSMSEGGVISDCVSRTASFDTIYHDGDKYFVDYSFTSTAYYVKPDPELVTDETVSGHTCELYPHIRFTPYLRRLCEYIIKDEKNPLLKARAIYDYITKNVKYSYMREYRGLTDIPEFCALNLRGDCGVQALLFITLCRIAGVPADWQSGLSIHPDFITSHDWARYYVAPYGWIFCDLSRGQGAWQDGDYALHDFSFSNIDPWRMAANNAFQHEFDPPKAQTRADPYDGQSGEIEYPSYGLSDNEIERTREILGTEKL